MVKATAAVALVLALGGCKDDKKAGPAGGKPTPAARGCGVAPERVADWLTNLQLGPVTEAEGSKQAAWWSTSQDVMETMVSIAGFEDWCASTKPVADDCFEASNAERTDCATPIAQIADLRVRDQCASELSARGGEWLVIDDGVARGQPETPEHTAFLEKADAYRARMPEDRTALCTDGIALECFARPTAPSCKALIGKLRAALAPAPATEPPVAPR